VLPIETDDETAQNRTSVIRLARVHRLTVYGVIYLDLAGGIARATRSKDLRRAAAAADVSLIET